jgi:hypothetical protein
MPKFGPAILAAIGLPLLLASVSAQETAAPQRPQPVEPPSATGSIDPAADDKAVAPVADWIGKPVISADGINVGDVADVQVDDAGRPISITTEVGGFLGFGSAPVRLTVSDGSFDGEEVRVGLVETDIAALAAGDPNSPLIQSQDPD